MIRLIDTDGDEFFVLQHDIRRVSVVHQPETSDHRFRMYFYDEAEITITVNDDEYNKFVEVLMTENE